jgi:Bacterial regulatory proteins, luxR family
MRLATCSRAKSRPAICHFSQRASSVETRSSLRTGARSTTSLSRVDRRASRPASASKTVRTHQSEGTDGRYRVGLIQLHQNRSRADNQRDRPRDGIECKQVQDGSPGLFAAHPDIRTRSCAAYCPRITNAQIAERLVVSPHTVERHVENILDKLHLSSRTAIAVWVVEHERG